MVKFVPLSEYASFDWKQRPLTVVLVRALPAFLKTFLLGLFPRGISCAESIRKLLSTYYECGGRYC